MGMIVVKTECMQDGQGQVLQQRLIGNLDMAVSPGTQGYADDQGFR